MYPPTLPTAHGQSTTAQLRVVALVDHPNNLGFAAFTRLPRLRYPFYPRLSVASADSPISLLHSGHHHPPKPLSLRPTPLRLRLRTSPTHAHPTWGWDSAKRLWAEGYDSPPEVDPRPHRADSVPNPCTEALLCDLAGLWEEAVHAAGRTAVGALAAVLAPHTNRSDDRPVRQPRCLSGAGRRRDARYPRRQCRLRLRIIQPPSRRTLGSPILPLCLTDDRTISSIPASCVPLSLIIDDGVSLISASSVTAFNHHAD